MNKVSDYVVGMMRQLDHMQKIIEAEEAFRVESRNFFKAAISHGIVLEMPESLLAQENQLPQLKERLVTLQKQINLGIY